jgi:hypothetical protein
MQFIYELPSKNNVRQVTPFRLYTILQPLSKFTVALPNISSSKLAFSRRMESFSSWMLRGLFMYTVDLR